MNLQTAAQNFAALATALTKSEWTVSTNTYAPNNSASISNATLNIGLYMECTRGGNTIKLRCSFTGALANYMPTYRTSTYRTHRGWKTKALRQNDDTTRFAISAYDYISKTALKDREQAQQTLDQRVSAEQRIVASARILQEGMPTGSVATTRYSEHGEFQNGAQLPMRDSQMPWVSFTVSDSRVGEVVDFDLHRIDSATAVAIIEAIKASPRLSSTAVVSATTTNL